MAHLGYEDSLIRGFNEAQISQHPDFAVRKSWERQDQAESAILAAVTKLARRIDAVEKNAAPARPAPLSPSAPARIPPAIERLSEKLREQSIASSRARY